MIHASSLFVIINTHHVWLNHSIIQFFNNVEFMTFFLSNSVELLSALKDHVITSMSCGKSHSMAVNEWGQLFAWGSNSTEQLGLEIVETYVAFPKLVKSLATKQIVQIASGNDHNLALTSGRISLHLSSCLGRTFHIAQCKSSFINAYIAMSTRIDQDKLSFCSSFNK